MASAPGPGPPKAALWVISVSGHQGHSGQAGRTGMVWALSHLPRKSAQRFQMAPTLRGEEGEGAGMASGHHHHVSQLQTANSSPLEVHALFCSLFRLGLRRVSRPPPADRPPLGFALVSVSYVGAAMFFLGVGVGGRGGQLCAPSCRQGAGPLAHNPHLQCPW